MELKDKKLRILFIQHLLYTLYIHYLQAIQYYRVSILITFMSWMRKLRFREAR